MKSKLLLSAAFAASMIAAGPAFAADYVIDKKGQHAFVTFKVSHLGYSHIIGRFNDFDGKFSHDAGNPGASNVDVTINTKSIDTNHAERDKHLRSADFLEVEKYPTITFKSTGYESGDDNDTLKGDLTIHGVNQIGEGKDPWGGYRSGFQGDIMLKAGEFGLPDWVGDIEVELNIEGVRQ